MIMDLLRRLNAEGTTIIQVTHNEEWAGYGHRTIELLDGWIAKPQSTSTGVIA
jgi:ABC-type lipoprotein export system ATPase subunit